MAKKEKADYTAIGIASIRAVESMKPEGRRLFYDPYAKTFARSSLTGRFLILLGRALSGLLTRRGNGEWGFVLSRVKYIDDFLQECIDDGIQQLVILGAGFDSRAYRFDTLGKGIGVFEVDLPATQNLKRKLLGTILGTLPDNVHFVPVNFDTESLEERLPATGYNDTLKTLFTWEGVIAYISQDAANAVLAFMANKSGEGSSIIFDYPTTHETHPFWAYPHAFENLEDGGIEQIMESRGFYDVVNATSEDFRKLYFEGKKVKISPKFAIVHATT